MTAASFSSTLELIERLIENASSAPTRLIVCSTKDEFLSQLIPPLVESHQPTAPQEIPSSQDEPINLETVAKRNLPHPLVTPTLRLLAATRTIKLAFCPSISSLRAYLAGHDFQETAIILLGLIQLHHSTSEFSAQGLSRSLAGAVSAAARVNDTHLHLVECGDILDPSNPYRGRRIWDAEVPLLSSSVRIGGDGASWAGRTINVRRIVSRWFDFQKSPQPGQGPGIERDGRKGESEEDMLV